MIDSTPLVVIAGQVGTGFLGTDAFQEVDLVGITQPITKWSYQIRSAEDVPWAVARAFYVAKSGIRVSSAASCSPRCCAQRRLRLR